MRNFKYRVGDKAPPSSPPLLTKEEVGRTEEKKKHNAIFVTYRCIVSYPQLTDNPDSRNKRSGNLKGLYRYAHNRLFQEAHKDP